MSLPSPNLPDKEWKREVARTVGPRVSGYPFPIFDADPDTTDLRASFSYYNTTTNKVRTWDGLAWNNHF